MDWCPSLSHWGLTSTGLCTGAVLGTSPSVWLAHTLCLAAPQCLQLNDAFTLNSSSIQPVCFHKLNLEHVLRRSCRTLESTVCSSFLQKNSVLPFNSCVSACSNDFHSYRDHDELVSGISSRSLPPRSLGETHSHEKKPFVGASIQKKKPASPPPPVTTTEKEGWLGF